MIRFILGVLLALTVASCGTNKNVAGTEENQPCGCDFKVYQGHDKEAPQEIVALMRETNTTDNNSLKFAVFALTYAPFVDEIINAHKRGVDVEGIVDKSQSSGDAMLTQLQRLQEAGVPIKWGDNKGLMHMKLLVTKKGYASGSFNWSKSAQKSNDEVLEVGRSCESGRIQYEKIWEEVYGKNNPADLQQLIQEKDRKAANRAIRMDTNSILRLRIGVKAYPELLRRKYNVRTNHGYQHSVLVRIFFPRRKSASNRFQVA